MTGRSSAVEWSIWVGAGVVALWRLMALFFPHVAITDPAPVQIAMASVGMLFVVCGLWAYRRVPGPATTLFAFYALCAGLHRGGAVGLGPPPLQTVEIVLYVVMSSVLGQTLFLHLALVFPRRFRTVTRPPSLILLYVPALAGGVLVAVVAAFPGSIEAVIGSAVQVLAVIGTLCGIAAAVVWIVRLIVSPEDRRNGHLPLVVGAILAGALPNMIVSAIGPLSDLDGLSNLLVALEPPVLAFALTRAPDSVSRPAR